MNKIKRSWELTKASLNVLKHDKELIVFPIISAVMMVVITLTFLIPTLVGNFLDQIINTCLLYTSQLRDILIDRGFN